MQDLNDLMEVAELYKERIVDDYDDYLRSGDEKFAKDMWQNIGRVLYAITDEEDNQEFTKQLFKELNGKRTEVINHLLDNTLARDVLLVQALFTGKKIMSQLLTENLFEGIKLQIQDDNKQGFKRYDEKPYEERGEKIFRASFGFSLQHNREVSDFLGRLPEPEFRTADISPETLERLEKELHEFMKDMTEENRHK